MTATFHVGDALEVMAKLPEKSVDLVLSSPPFLALRSYLPSDDPNKHLEGGSQATPGEYVDWLLDVVEACARVLAPHGSLCFELGDTYSGSGGAGGDYEETGLRGGQNHFDGSASGNRRAARKGYGGAADRLDGTVRKNSPAWPLAKSLSLIPESFRFAMVYGINPHTGRRTEPWRLRNVIRWVRPNPPVGALGDKFRPATSELMVFCKAKDRYFDLDAVREPVQFPDKTRTMGKKPGVTTDHKDANFPGDLVWVDKQDANNPAGAPPLDWWNIPLLEGEEPTRYGPKEQPRSHPRTAKGVESAPRSAKSAERGGNWASLPELHETQGAPPLDWWNIPPGGYEGAHYAVFPKELLVKPIRAMCPEKVCRQCGEARRRITESARIIDGEPANAESPLYRPARASSGGGAYTRGGHYTFETSVTTLGFSDCGHDDWRPGLVLDPFAGSGTTLAVATGHGRDAIGIDLDRRNFDLALDRVGPLILEQGVLS